MNEQRLELT